MTILDKITAQKAIEVSQAKANVGEAVLRNSAFF